MSATVVRRADGFVEISFSYRQWIVESLKSRIPSYSRTWEPDRKVWTYEPTWALAAIEILEAAFGFDDVHIIDQDRKSPPEWDQPDAPDQSFATLHVLPSMPPDVIVVVYKALAKRNHPDRGGDTATMQRINQAYEDLKVRGVLAGGRS